MREPEGSSGSPRFSSVTLIVAVSGAVVVLVLGIILGAMLQGRADGSGGSTGYLPSDSLSSPSPIPPAPAPTDTIGVSDPEVSAWHESLGPVIGGVYTLMAAPAPENQQEVARTCEQLALSLQALTAAPAAPKADLEKSYRAWVEALSSAVSMCQLGPQGKPEAEWLAEVSTALSGTASLFDEFGRTLDLYFDFSAIPQG